MTTHAPRLEQRLHLLEEVPLRLSVRTEHRYGEQEHTDERDSRTHHHTSIMTTAPLTSKSNRTSAFMRGYNVGMDDNLPHPEAPEVWARRMRKQGRVLRWAGWIGVLIWFLGFLAIPILFVWGLRNF